MKPLDEIVKTRVYSIHKFEYALIGLVSDYNCPYLCKDSFGFKIANLESSQSQIWLESINIWEIPFKVTYFDIPIREKLMKIFDYFKQLGEKYNYSGPPPSEAEIIEAYGDTYFNCLNDTYFVRRIYEDSREITHDLIKLNQLVKQL